MSDRENTELEIKIAFLERHAEEQDKAMLSLGRELAALRREVKALLERVPQQQGEPGAPGDERPPHY